MFAGSYALWVNLFSSYNFHLRYLTSLRMILWYENRGISVFIVAIVAKSLVVVVAVLAEVVKSSVIAIKENNLTVLYKCDDTYVVSFVLSSAQVLIIFFIVVQSLFCSKCSIMHWLTWDVLLTCLVTWF